MTRTNSVLLTITQAKLEAERKNEEAEEVEAARLQAAAESQVRTLHQFVRTLAFSNLLPSHPTRIILEWSRVPINIDTKRFTEATETYYDRKRDLL